MRGVDPEYAVSVIHGRRAIDSLRLIRPDLDAEEELEILEDFEVEDVDDIVVLPGVRELLKSLPHDRWTVVTSATERLASVRSLQPGCRCRTSLSTARRSPRGSPILRHSWPGAEAAGIRAGRVRGV